VSQTTIERDKNGNVTVHFVSQPPKILRITERAILFIFMGRSFWADLPKGYAHLIPRDKEEREKLVERINSRIEKDGGENREEGSQPAAAQEDHP